MARVCCRSAATAPTTPNANSGRAASPNVDASSPSLPTPPDGMLPRAVADITSTAPRAIEWPTGAKPNWRKTSTPSAGTAQATAPALLRPAERDLTASMAANAAATATHIQALVEVMHANAASRAASFIRFRTAARPDAVSRAVRSGSTTAEPDVNRNTGFRTRRATADRAWRMFGARAYTPAAVTTPSSALNAFSHPVCHRQDGKCTQAGEALHQRGGIAHSNVGLVPPLLSGMHDVVLGCPDEDASGSQRAAERDHCVERHARAEDLAEKGRDSRPPPPAAPRLCGDETKPRRDADEDRDR